MSELTSNLQIGTHKPFIEIQTGACFPNFLVSVQRKDTEGIMNFELVQAQSCNELLLLRFPDLCEMTLYAQSQDALGLQHTKPFLKQQVHADSLWRKFFAIKVPPKVLLATTEATSQVTCSVQAQDSH